MRSPTGEGAGLEALKRLIIDRTEGNPFFMEETVQVLFDEGALVRNGAVKLTRPLNQLKIPPTVQAILAARIDRLAPDQKELLQTLAVIGTEFKLGLVRKVGLERARPYLRPRASRPPRMQSWNRCCPNSSSASSSTSSPRSAISSTSSSTR